MSKSSGRPSQMGSSNDHFGREEQKEEEVLPTASVSRSHDRVAERGPYVKVNHPSSLTSSSSVHFSSLKSGIPMCGPTPEPRVRSNLNPAVEGFVLRVAAAEGFVPTPDQVQAWGQLLLQQMSQPLITWLLQEGISGVQPKAVDPMHGLSPRP